MIQFSEIVADWPLNDGLQWLQRDYLPDQDRKIQAIVRKVGHLNGKIYNLDLDVEARLELKNAKWNGLSGEFIPQTVPWTIKVYWPREMDSEDVLFNRIVMHEMGHLYAMLNGEEMISTGHGVKSDFIVKAVNQFIGEAYPIGHWSWPGIIGN